MNLDETTHDLQCLQIQLVVFDALRFNLYNWHIIDNRA